MAMKKRGWGQGWWNGSGGKPLEGETIESAVVREVKEELRVDLISIEKVGEINWFHKEEDKNVICYVFLSEKWTEEPQESEEMSPKWFKKSEIPYDKMWASDREWLPLILAQGKKIKAKFVYLKEGAEVESRKIVEVEGF